MGAVVVLFSFLLFFLGGTLLVGLMAQRRGERSEGDYYLASQRVSPYALALSASASKLSGFMFAGFMGKSYVIGTGIIWFGLGLIVGSVLVYSLAVARIQFSNRGGWALSLGELITFQEGENRVWLRRFIGCISLFFLTIYAAAQLKAGGMALQVAIDQPLYIGILLGAAVILFYCWSGGIRASTWTDVLQTIFMLGSLLLLLVVAVIKEGGISELYEAFMATAPQGSEETALFPQNLSSVGGYFGVLLFFLGGFGFGCASIGQPHGVVRMMALQDSVAATRKFLATICIFETVFLTTAVLVGLSTRVVLQDAGDFHAELSLFLSAKELLPAMAVGFILAGVFSATLSSADSQIISCSSSLVRDLPEPPRASLALAKASTIAIVLLATAAALWLGGDIFSLVSFAATGLSASIGSLLVLRLFNLAIPEWGAILVSLAGGATVVLWHFSELRAYLNEGVPGLVAAFLVFLLIRAALAVHSARGEKQQKN